MLADLMHPTVNPLHAQVEIIFQSSYPDGGSPAVIIMVPALFLFRIVKQLQQYSSVISPSPDDLMGNVPYAHFDTAIFTKGLNQVV